MTTNRRRYDKPRVIGLFSGSTARLWIRELVAHHGIIIRHARMQALDYQRRADKAEGEREVYVELGRAFFGIEL